MAQGRIRHGYGIAKAVNLVAMVAIIVGFSAWADEAQAHDAQVEEQILAAERAAMRGPYANDGVFTGSAEGFGGTVEMQVTVDGGYITSVDILDASNEDDAWLDMAVVLLDRIKQSQTTDIDVVSGATYTSAGILNGCAEALRKSMGDAA